MDQRVPTPETDDLSEGVVGAYVAELARFRAGPNLRVDPELASYLALDQRIERDDQDVVDLELARLERRTQSATYRVRAAAASVAAVVVIGALGMADVLPAAAQSAFRSAVGVLGVEVDAGADPPSTADTTADVTSDHNVSSGVASGEAVTSGHGATAAAGAAAVPASGTSGSAAATDGTLATVATTPDASTPSDPEAGRGHGSGDAKKDPDGKGAKKDGEGRKEPGGRGAESEGASGPGGSEGPGGGHTPPPPPDPAPQQP